MTQDVNNLLSRVLCLPPRCTGFELRARVGEVPTLTAATIVGTEFIREETTVFDLVPRPAPQPTASTEPFDLDAACAAALARVNAGIEAAYLEARVSMALQPHLRVNQVSRQFATGGFVSSKPRR